ncbi:MAG: formimidoylglutamate deiminase, partial [Cognatishimia activa]
MRIHARHMLMGDRWVSDALVTSADGKIASIDLGVKPEPQDHRVDILLPALANLHSHTFQRAMAGMTEVRAAGKESFWTWRDLMYRFLNHLTPDHYEAIA